MKVLLGVHHIPMHQTGEHYAWFNQITPPIYKVVVTGTDVDLTQAPSGAKIVIRYHQLSENFGHRGADDAFLPPSVPRAPTVGLKPRELTTFLRDYPVRRQVVLEQNIQKQYPAPRALTLDLATNATQCGKQHAEINAAIGQKLASNGINLNNLYFEYLNEPQLWSVEPPGLYAIYATAVLERAHQLGIRTLIGNFGVGWPGNGGVQDAPPIWAPFLPMIQAMNSNDALGLHEYCGLSGHTSGWKWLMGRYVQCPYQVPIIVSECGIDRGVEGRSGHGWFDLPGSMDQKAGVYMDILRAYEFELRKDLRILGYTPFTSDGDGSDWASFEVLVPQLMSLMSQHAAWVREQPETAPDLPPVPPGLAHLPENEPEGTAAFLADKVRWWLEEYARQREANNTARANAIMYSLIKLLYRLERLLKQV